MMIFFNDGSIVCIYVCQKSIDYANFGAPNKPIYCMRRSNLEFGTFKLPFFVFLIGQIKDFGNLSTSYTTKSKSLGGPFHVRYILDVLFGHL